MSQGSDTGWLAAVVASADDAILSKSLEGTVLTWNAAAEAMYGYAADEIVGKSVQELVPPDRPDELPDILARIGRGERVERLLTKRVTKDGRLLDVSLSISPVLDEAGAVVGAATIARDVTAHLQLAAQLRQAQKMEAIGRLAGGIAHDFNNLLTGINGYGRLALELDDEADRRGAIEQVIRAGERAAELTKRLLAFSRREAVEARLVDANEVVRDLEPLLRRLIGEDVDVQVFLGDDLEPVLTDPSQVEQVILNLCVNARDAMPEGGRLTIETGNVQLGPDYAALHEGVRPGPYVLIAVTDTGVGMDDATRARLFEPFFTTKPRGQGTGLGLSTVYGIVERAGGHVWLYSEPGRGAVFKVYLPQAAGSPVDVPGERVPQTGLEGAERVLLLEDDDVVRELVAYWLERAGYTVRAAATPTDALAAWCNEGPFEALVSDVVLPEMSGPELVARLGPEPPRTVFMSGYTGETVVHHGLLDRGDAFVDKPFTPETLLLALRRVLRDS
jgi:PAS domain S-box-containing protein